MPATTPRNSPLPRRTLRSTGSWFFDSYKQRTERVLRITALLPADFRGRLDGTMPGLLALMLMVETRAKRECNVKKSCSYGGFFGIVMAVKRSCRKYGEKSRRMG